MASGLYLNYKLQMLGAAAAAHTLVDWDNDTVKVGIVSGADYSEDLTADVDWADITAKAAGYTLDTCYNSEATQTLSNIDLTTTPGTVDNTANITFTGVAIDGAKDVDGIVHYRASGSDASTDPLLTFHDGFSAVTPNGGDIVIAYNASGIFSL